MEIYVNHYSSLSIEEKFKYGKNAWIDKCYYEAELFITDCAEQGDAEAQYILGEIINMKGKNGTEWLVTMRFSDWVEWYKHEYSEQ